MPDELTQDPKKLAAQEAFKRELERRSLDRIKIYNPMDEDYVCYWDGYGNRFPTKQTTIIFRYIAVKAMHEMIDKILTANAQKVIDQTNAKRDSLGQPRLTPQEREVIEGGTELKITEKALRRPWVKQIWKGIAEEYGMDKVIAAEPPKPQDSRPVDEQLLEEIDEATLVDNEVTIQKNLIKADFNEEEDTLNVEPPTITTTEIPTTTTEIVPEEAPRGRHAKRV